MLAFSTGGILYFFKKTRCMYLSWLCWVFVASLAFSGCGEQGLLVAVASLVAEPRLETMGSVVWAHGLCCPEACGIFPDQRSNPSPLHRQALGHRGARAIDF